MIWGEGRGATVEEVLKHRRRIGPSITTVIIKREVMEAPLFVDIRTPVLSTTVF